MKKTLLLSLVMLVGLTMGLSSCGKKVNSDTSDNGSTTTTESVEKKGGNAMDNLLDKYEDQLNEVISLIDEGEKDGKLSVDAMQKIANLFMDIGNTNMDVANKAGDLTAEQTDRFSELTKKLQTYTEKYSKLVKNQ